jgi:predicted AlkP superfamily phosphohydrolase/phosphomutase
MGWDGAGWNNVGPMLEAGLLPNLQALIAEGAHVLPIELIGRTNTLTTWTQVFTGLTYDQTGVTGNHHGRNRISPRSPERPFPELNHWIRQVPYDWTLPSLIQHKRGVRIGWITSKPYLGADRSVSPLAGIAENADMYAMVTPEQGGPDDYISDLRAEAMRFIASSGDQGGYFLFFHVNPDHYGHVHGEGSDRYREEFVRADEALGRVRRYAPGAHCIVMTDHGFDPGRYWHDSAPDAWAVTTLPVHPDYHLAPGQRAAATPRDIGTMLFDAYNFELDRHRPQLRGKRLLV